MILGIGFDLVELCRIRRLYTSHPDSFVDRILTANERHQLDTITHERRRIEWLAGRFAAKEAFVKALGTGFSQSIGLHSVEVLSAANGRPELHVNTAVNERWPIDSRIDFHVTITHTTTTAGAMVIVEQV